MLDGLYDSIGSGRLNLPDDYSCDIFVSAFNLSERVRFVYDRIDAKSKFWVIHNEYYFEESELPADGVLIFSDASEETEFVVGVMDVALEGADRSSRICVDSTGFMRPHLMFMLLYLQGKGFTSLDVIYTEPSHYSRKAETVFSSDVYEVRQVGGYEGAHSTDLSKDVLLIGCGYDHGLVSEVISYKGGARVLQLLSLPSLSADMYQESLVRLQRVVDSPSSVSEVQIAYASANDPFATFMALEESISRIARAQGVVTNLYLSPLATKPQVIGFCLFYIKRLGGEPASMIFPFARSYSKETSKGVGRVWLYKLDL